jgi:hypothetical protein
MLLHMIHASTGINVLRYDCTGYECAWREDDCTKTMSVDRGDGYGVIRLLSGEDYAMIGRLPATFNRETILIRSSG